MKKLLQASLVLTSVLVLSGCDIDDDFNNPTYSTNTTTVRSVQRSGNAVTTTTRQTTVTVSPDRAPQMAPQMTPRPSRVVVRQPAPSAPAPVIAAPMPTTAPVMSAPPMTAPSDGYND